MEKKKKSKTSHQIQTSSILRTRWKESKGKGRELQQHLPSHNPPQYKTHKQEKAILTNFSSSSSRVTVIKLYVA